MLEAIIRDTIKNSTPIVLAASGGLLTEVSGWLNIGLEGAILSAAFFAVVVSSSTGSVFFGTLAAITVAMTLSSMIFFAVRYLKANLFVVGIAVNLLSVGVTVTLTYNWFLSKGTVVFSGSPRPVVLSLDFLTGSGFGWLNGLSLFDLSAFVAPLFLLLFFKKTFTGVKLRSCGFDEESAFYSGVQVNDLRFLAYIGSGIFSGLAGAALSIPMGAFVSNMSGGRGWLALVAVIMGRKNPLIVLLSALMLGFVTELSVFLQVATEISPKLLLSLPYFASFIILAISCGENKDKRFKDW
ncbi:MAG: ABC transporter permease [Kosmotogaceae bacterium]|nr:ABC transporter permease [Kosmotogaceae bacterium]